MGPSATADPARADRNAQQHNVEGGGKEAEGGKHSNPSTLGNRPTINFLFYQPFVPPRTHTDGDTVLIPFPTPKQMYTDDDFTEILSHCKSIERSIYSYFDATVPPRVDTGNDTP